jgi:hypothetical protein
MYTVEYLLAHSNLRGRGEPGAPVRLCEGGGPRRRVDACLALLGPETRIPLRIRGMCGILGYALGARGHTERLDFWSPYASHGSWRIREAAAMGIQEFRRMPRRP